jgi:hypothetical protein
MGQFCAASVRTSDTICVLNVESHYVICELRAVVAFGLLQVVGRPTNFQTKQQLQMHATHTKTC